MYFYKNITKKKVNEFVYDEIFDDSGKLYSKKIKKVYYYRPITSESNVVYKTVTYTYLDGKVITKTKCVQRPKRRVDGPTF